MRLSVFDAIELFNSAEIYELGESANRFTGLLHDDKVRTYTVDRNINYTNVCESRCKFCAFCRNSNDADAYIISESQLIEKIEQTIALGGRQVLLQGGLHPDLPIEWYESMLRLISSRFPNLNIHGFSPTEIAFLSDKYGKSDEEILLRFRSAGLGSLPGGGAEILVDRLRSHLSPKKASALRWLSVCKTWHRLGGRGSITMMFGHIETLEERFEHLHKIREHQDEMLAENHAGFTAFIPWTFQPGNTQLSDVSKIGASEYLRFLAISRLFLDNISTIQSSWVTQGLEIGSLGLSFGANDLGSIMIEENVVAAAGTIFRATEESFCNSIRSAGFDPKRREM